MQDEMIAAVADVLAKAAGPRIAELAVEGGHKAVRSLVALVKRRFAGEVGAERALAAAQADPDTGTQRLAGALRYLTDDDEDFAGQLRDWAAANLKDGNTFIGSVNDNATVNQYNNSTVTVHHHSA